jgi:hypothetical protein
MLRIIVLMIVLAALMATVCFGLIVLLISVVGRLWPSKGFPAQFHHPVAHHTKPKTV